MALTITVYLMVVEGSIRFVDEPLQIARGQLEPLAIQNGDVRIE